MARTFLEIEHGIGNVNDESYQGALSHLLREISSASYAKTSLLKIRTAISNVLLSGEETKAETVSAAPQDSTLEPAKEETTTAPVTKSPSSAITVRMT